MAALGEPILDALLARPLRTDGTAGLPTGTPVLTMEGELPVEHLTAGDRIITCDAGMSVLREVRVTEAPGRAVRIAAGALGPNRPEADILLAPGTQVNLRPWNRPAFNAGRLVSAAGLAADGLADGAIEADARHLSFFTLHFDGPRIVYARGLEIGTP